MDGWVGDLRVSKYEAATEPLKLATEPMLTMEVESVAGLGNGSRCAW